MMASGQLILDDFKFPIAEHIPLYQHPKPFIKWAGGKHQLLSELGKMVPNQFNRYFEPFLGGGALFFYMISKRMGFNAYLSDTNVELITAYNAIKDNAKGVIELLQSEYKEYTLIARNRQ